MEKEVSHITVKNTLVLLFIVFHTSAILYWNLPKESYIHVQLYDHIRWYPQYTGLWQDWHLFAPNPYWYTLNSRVLGQAQDGRIIVENPRYTKQGWILVRNEKLIYNLLDTGRTMIYYYLKYWCRTMNEHDRVVEVKLLVQTQLMVPFGHSTVKQAPFQEIMSMRCR